MVSRLQAINPEHLSPPQGGRLGPLMWDGFRAFLGHMTEWEWEGKGRPVPSCLEAGRDGGLGKGASASPGQPNSFAGKEERPSSVPWKTPQSCPVTVLEHTGGSDHTELAGVWATRGSSWPPRPPAAETLGTRPTPAGHSVPGSLGTGTLCCQLRVSHPPSQERGFQKVWEGWDFQNGKQEV